MADWLGSQALQTDELWSPSRTACSGVGETGSVLQVALNWQPHIMRKSFISHRLSGLTKWIHSGFLQPVMPGTLCHQHRQRRACWELQTRDPETWASLANAQSLWPGLTKRTVKITDWHCGSHADHRGLMTPPLRRAMVRCTCLWATVFCLHCLIRNRDMDDLSWCQHSAMAQDTMHPIKWYRRSAQLLAKPTSSFLKNY